MGLERLRNLRRKSLAVHRQRPARRHLMPVSGGHDQRTRRAHFPMQKPNRILVRIIGTERIGTHEFGKAAGLVGIGAHLGPHLVQHHRNPGSRHLPGRLGPRHAGPDNVNRFCHGVGLAQSGKAFQINRRCAMLLA